ncbi:hypothetical protein DFJ73DRAFT_781935 [Zopfochytrium polystomum]|nr:hypothetical protein DFJ73DRAFT_781935 [Zopfochytrium polystomum]
MPAQWNARAPPPDEVVSAARRSGASQTTLPAITEQSEDSVSLGAFVVYIFFSIVGFTLILYCIALAAHRRRQFIRNLELLAADAGNQSALFLFKDRSCEVHPVTSLHRDVSGGDRSQDKIVAEGGRPGSASSHMDGDGAAMRDAHHSGTFDAPRPLCPSQDVETHPGAEASPRGAKPKGDGLNTIESADAVAVPCAASGPAPECFYFGEKDETCVMCVQPFQELEIVRVLPCGHVFHRECIDQWLRIKSQCPTCRMLVFRHPQAAGRPSVSVTPPTVVLSDRNWLEEAAAGAAASRETGAVEASSSDARGLRLWWRRFFAGRAAAG